MSQFCPKCTADTQPIEEETSSGFCIHELILLTGISFVAGIIVGTAGRGAF